MACLERGGDRDQEIGKLVVERLDPAAGLEVHEQDRNRRSEAEHDDGDESRSTE